MLRIGTPPAPPLPDPGPNNPANSGEEQDATGAPTNQPDDMGGGDKLVTPKYDVDKVDPQVARYMGPENGPAECERCKFWLAPNACHIVSGPIHPEGWCALFTPNGEQGGAEEGLPGLDEDSMARETPDVGGDQGTPEMGGM